MCEKKVNFLSPPPCSSPHKAYSKEKREKIEKEKGPALYFVLLILLYTNVERNMNDNLRATIVYIYVTLLSQTFW